MLLSFILLCVNIGCSSIRYGDFKYTRLLGKQEIKGLTVTIDPDGTKHITLDSSSGSNADMASALNRMTEIMAKMAVIP